MLINIGLSVCNINALERNASAGRFLQTVQTAKERTLSGVGRADNENNIPLLISTSIPFNTSRSPKLFFRPLTRIRGCIVLSLTLSQPPLKSLHQIRKYDHEYQINKCHRQ